jgi:hypothetical protein
MAGGSGGASTQHGNVLPADMDLAGQVSTCGSSGFQGVIHGLGLAPGLRQQCGYPLPVRVAPRHQVLVRARVHNTRGKGKSAFLVLRQRTATVQVCVLALCLLLGMAL